MSFLRTCRILSIDILAGVLAGFAFAVTLLESSVPGLVPVFICSAVWLVYTLDHLGDAYYLGSEAVKPVYRWHWRNRKKLLYTVAVLAGASLVASLIWLPFLVIYCGIMGTGILSIYMLLHSRPAFKKRYLFKEIWIAVIYTTGVWGFPYLYRGKSLDITLILLILSFFLLVLVNVLSYSRYEIEVDREEKLSTLATRFGEKACRNMIFCLLLISMVLLSLCIYLSVNEFIRPWAALILIMMCIILGEIHLKPEYFRRNAWFGILADGIFILPGAIALL
ncbi:UbiA family prenyltransferase [Bacteroidota bacterium]